MRTKDSRRRQDQRRGSTIVEFSLAFTAFIMLLMGMMEFGRAVWTFSTLSHAVSQGDRYRRLSQSQFDRSGSQPGDRQHRLEPEQRSRQRVHHHSQLPAHHDHGIGLL